ncbi:hypothetical protein EIP86_011151 [Pleurotus ostreatoroseus]|nr:hypothetical protein EIP86_011151 [Pleurotus ostreatoroseus]
MHGVLHSQSSVQGHIVSGRASSSSALLLELSHHEQGPTVDQLGCPASVRPEITASLAENGQPHAENLLPSHSKPRSMNAAPLRSIQPTFKARPVSTTSVPENPPPLLAPRGIRPLPTICQVNELADRRTLERSLAPAPETPQPNFRTIETGSAIEPEVVEELYDIEPALDEANDQENIDNPAGDIAEPLSRYDLVPYFARPKDCWDYYEDKDPALARTASKEILTKTVADMETIHRRLVYYSHHARQARREVKAVLRAAKVTRRLFHQERANTDRTRTFALHYRPVPDRWSVNDLWGWPMTLERKKDGELVEFDPEEENDPETEDEDDHQDRDQKTKPEPGPPAGPSRQAHAGHAGPPDVFLPEHELRISDIPTDTLTPPFPSKPSSPLKRSAPFAVSKRKAATAFTGSSAENGHPYKRQRQGDAVVSVQYGDDADDSLILLEFTDDVYDEDADDALDEKTVESAIFPDSDRENENSDDEGPILPDSIPLIGPGAHRRRLMRAPVYTK